MREMKLLEQALERAHYVRTGTRLSGKEPERSKPARLPKDFAVTSKEAKGDRPAGKSSRKSASGDKKAPKKHGISSSLDTCASRKSKRGIASNASGSYPRTVQRQAVKSGKATASVSTSAASCKATAEAQTALLPVMSSQSAASCKATTEAQTALLPVMSSQKGDTADMPQSIRLESEQTADWISVSLKQNKMWDKVMGSHRKIVPGRSRFMERMRATFPKDWPRGSPEQTGALVSRLNHRVEELARRCQTMDYLDQMTPEQEEEAGMRKDGCSHTTLERLQTTAEELQSIAWKAKQEWETWDRRRPEGALFDAAEAVACHLPVTVVYASEAELQELEAVRMRVALLQQEVDLQQALVDALAPKLASSVASRTEPSVLRDLYSLLGEGGQRFPAIVLDSD
ncbi:uncharacterized protein LOC130904661 isoform X2 [Corythoichthys intestinalis]|nr:uncharacterized protein LOC130904661 isoform X2 [Corythoichthys intestinalis]XP_057673565.1 uncharacterized protein LOC130904661 isoform X2 [Corythoichthys intestinalis]